MSLLLRQKDPMSLLLRAELSNVVVASGRTIKCRCCFSRKPDVAALTPLFGKLTALRPTASRLSPVDLANFFAREDLADFLHEVLLDFLVS